MDDGCWTTVAEVLVIREGAPELVVGNEFVAPFRLGAMSPGKTVITNPDGNVIVVVPSGFLTTSATRKVMVCGLVCAKATGGKPQNNIARIIRCIPLICPNPLSA